MPAACWAPLDKNDYSMAAEAFPRAFALAEASCAGHPRTAIPLPLARFRARDQLTELRATNLQSTTEEAAALLNPVVSYDFSPADLGALEAHTEEWWCGARPNCTAGA